MSDRRGSAVEVRSAQRGEKRRLADMAARNARLALEHDTILRERTRARRIEALEELREQLNLESLPVRIECFDVSNLGETNPVASMVVFEDAVAKKSDYRKFGIRHASGPDDFAMIAEAVSRRFARMTDMDGDRYDKSFATCPEPGRDRRRQGPAGRRHGGDGRVRPAPGGRRSRWPSARRRSSCPAAPSRSCSTAAPPACSCCSGPATRPTGSRSGSTAAAAARRRSTRSSTACPGSGPARRRLLMERFGTADALVARAATTSSRSPGCPPRSGAQIHAALHRTG